MSANPFKYPRTPHISGSCATSDDIVLKGNAGLLGELFVATEKMDGTNIVMTCDGMMTRSGNQPPSSWGYPLYSTWNRIAHIIPEGLGVCDEFLYWRKSVPYDSLTADFLVFSMIDLDAGMVLDWKTTTMWADELGIHMVPVIGHEDDYQNAVLQGHQHMEHKETEAFQLRALSFVILASSLFLSSVSMSQSSSGLGSQASEGTMGVMLS